MKTHRLPEEGSGSFVARAAAALLPPILHARVRRTWRREWAPAWEVVDEWAPPQVGWDQERVARAEEDAWPRHALMNSSTGVLGARTSQLRIGQAALWRHNTAVSNAYVLMLAARECRDGPLSILDWGGGVGHLNLTVKTVLPDVATRYEVRDLPALCRAGRRLQPGITFHEDDACLEGRFDLIVAISSLQYSKDWPAVLARMSAATDRYLFLSRVPTVFEHPSFIVRQRAYGVYEDTQYVSWVVNRQELLAAATASGLALVREFFSGEEIVVQRTPEQFETRGFLFRASGMP